MNNDVNENSSKQVVSQDTKTSQKPKKFWRVSSNIYAKRAGINFLNEELLTKVTGLSIFGPPLGKSGFPEYPEAPRILIDKKLGRPPQDFESFCSYWLISAEAKRVFESLDRDAFAFCKCEIKMPDGTDGPEYWLCDVLPMLDAVDEENSVLDIETDQNGSKWYGFVGKFDVKMRLEVVCHHRIFRLLYGKYSIICDDLFKDSCKGLKGIRFYSLKTK